MKNIILPLLTVLVSCGNSKVLTEQVDKKADFSYINLGQTNVACVQGTIIDETGEPLQYAQVILSDENWAIFDGSNTDENGFFKICVEREGEVNLSIRNFGSQTNEHKLMLQFGRAIVFNDTLIFEEQEIRLEKPIIYLYPPDTMDVDVKVELPGVLTNTYPQYNDGWQVKAFPNGEIQDKNGRNYYSLYWEGDMANLFELNSGTVVHRDETISFLETQLDNLGLNEREANEFIIFWMPILNASPYNLIHFSTTEYDSKVPLSIHPQPDHLIRIMMLYQPLDAPFACEPQYLEKTNIDRTGFTVVEWGGSKIAPPLN